MSRSDKTARDLDPYEACLLQIASEIKLLARWWQTKAAEAKQRGDEAYQENEHLRQENVWLRAFARAVLPSDKELDTFAPMLDSLEPYYADKYRKFLALRAELGSGKAE